ncbi:MFS transporter family glucose-6-phosphate receptor UhpC [Simkania sp.]|uniref:MFS transporter family glucose-6-phosphate receptor UhpC n=1 Tax=Simkania sp. TaxID=34094 RepID=UPI003B529914
MSVIDFFKPDPPQTPITDQEEIKKNYRYWRLRVFYSMYIGYALFYFTRKSFVFAMPALIADLGFDKGQLGILCSLLSISYGVSKFLSGVISDKANLRYFMGFGLIMTGVFNLFVGFSSSLILFGLFLGLNGLFQGWGSPPCARLLTYWYSQKERGRWWGVWNTSHNIGGALIPLICAVAIQLYGWRYAMYLPGALAIIVGFFLINRIRDNPKALGLPTVEKFRNDYTTESDVALDEEEESKEKRPQGSREILTEYVLKSKFIWILAISFFFVYVIRTAVNDWIQLYLMESKGFSLMVAGSCVFWFEIGGIFGSLAAGWLSDTVFKGKRGPVNVLFSLGIICTLFTLWTVPSSSVALISVIMFSIGFLIFGPQMLIGMAAAEMAGKKAAGSATGFAGLFAYTGAASAGYPFGHVIQSYGWAGFFVLLGICGVVAVSMLLPLWNRKPRTELVAG